MIPHFKSAEPSFMGDVKDMLARRVTRFHFEEILIRLELEFVHFFEWDDLITLWRRGSDMDAGLRPDIYRSDLVLEAVDPDGATHHVAAEAAYTADQRDTDRALHHANYVQRCTGSPVHTVISSVNVDREVQRLAANGTIHWYRLTDEDLEEAWQDMTR